jgi:hypothetical protein
LTDFTSILLELSSRLLVLIIGFKLVGLSLELISRLGFREVLELELSLDLDSLGLNSILSKSRSILRSILGLVLLLELVREGALELESKASR